jgi:hypothetical protein
LPVERGFQSGVRWWSNGGECLWQGKFCVVFGDKISRDDIMIGERSKRVLSTFCSPPQLGIKFNTIRILDRKI